MPPPHPFAVVSSSAGDTSGAIFAIILVAGLVTFLVVGGRRRVAQLSRAAEARTAAVRKAAGRLGLQFAEGPPEGVSMALMDGDRNVVHGTWKGAQVVAAQRIDVFKGREIVWTTCAVDVAADFPRVTIEFAPSDARLGEHLHPGRFRTESEEFDRAFSVGTDDREFATALLDPRMVDWLLANGSVADWVVEGARVAGRAKGVEPGRLHGLLDRCVEFAAHIPAVALTGHPAPGGPGSA